MGAENLVVWLKDVGMRDVAHVGGKNSSLGEMIRNLAGAGVKVPDGFATTSRAFLMFLQQNKLDNQISEALAKLDVDDLSALTTTGNQIREWIRAAPLPVALTEEVTHFYGELTKIAGEQVSFAVRSSATAEDLADASFAGQQESYLNVSGVENLLRAIRNVFASLYNDRAIAYRTHKNFSHSDVAISVGIQRMVRSDVGSSGVMFTLDTESGFDKVVFITSAFGLGEGLVQGAINPDEFYVYKPALEAKRTAIIRRQLGSKLTRMVYATDHAETSAEHRFIKMVAVPPEEQKSFSLSDNEVEQLARYALSIEKHYGRPMDIEWGKDGFDNELYILQARPETVKHSNKIESQERYRLKEPGEVLVAGRAIGQKIGAGVLRVVSSPREMSRVGNGDILVTDMTDPDWEPVMKRAAGIVTNRGGRTCHAAIIARELGIPAVVGCGDATSKLTDGTPATVSCADGDTGYVYRGLLDFEITSVSLDTLPKPPVKIMLNVGNPELAFTFQKLPNYGVGLARLEFIIAKMIGVHPRAVLQYPHLPKDLCTAVEAHAAGYDNPVEFYVEKLVEGVGTIAAAFYPKPVIVRLSDFKTNEYSGLVGGDLYEEKEENPMLGFRGASRYISHHFAECFKLECRALAKVRNEIGLTNVEIMVPFVRTIKEAKQVTELLAAEGLARNKNGLRLIMMCEIPSNAVLAAQFLEYFDGFSIGSNDMTQLTLGLDRDSGGIIANSFDERDAAVKAMLQMAIHACRREKKYIGICGQGPSDYPDFAQWLVEQGIESVSLNPDTVIDTWLYLAKQNR